MTVFLYNGSSWSTRVVFRKLRKTYKKLRNFTCPAVMHCRSYPIPSCRQSGPLRQCATACLRHSVANCSRMVIQIAQETQWRAYRKPPSLFRMVPSLTPYDLPSPQMGIPYAQDTRMAISPQRVIRYTSCLVLG